MGKDEKLTKERGKERRRKVRRKEQRREEEFLLEGFQRDWMTDMCRKELNGHQELPSSPARSVKQDHVKE